MLLKHYRIRTRHETQADSPEYEAHCWMAHTLNAHSIDEARAACIQQHADACRVPAESIEVVETLGGWNVYPLPR